MNLEVSEIILFELCQLGMMCSYGMLLTLFVAFDLCCSLMEVGEVARVVTDPTYAYGDIGRYVAALKSKVCSLICSPLVKYSTCLVVILYC